MHYTTPPCFKRGLVTQSQCLESFRFRIEYWIEINQYFPILTHVPIPGHEFSTCRSDVSRTNFTWSKLVDYWHACNMINPFYTNPIHLLVYMSPSRHFIKYLSEFRQCIKIIFILFITYNIIIYVFYNTIL